MRRLRVRLDALALAFSCLAASAAFAQQQTLPSPGAGPSAPRPSSTSAQPSAPGMPARDQASTPAATQGTGVIRGRVLALETGQPVRRVQLRVNLVSSASRGRLASTDAEGRYQLTDLPPGRYSIYAAKDGFVGLTYGQRGPRDVGRPVELADGQRLESIDFHLPRGAVIAGRVVDDFGEPMPDAAVSALQYQTIRGRRRLLPVRQIARTNDIGQFRLFGLPPGEYYVSATYRAPLLGSEDEAPAGHVSYAPTFFPNTTQAGEAQPVKVAVAQETSIELQMVPGRVLQVTGSVIDSTGRPLARGIVSLRGVADVLDTPPLSGALRPDGSFMVSAVPPGSYTLTIIGMSAQTQTPSPAGPPMFGMPPPAAPTPEMSQVPLTVADEDVRGLQLVAAKGAVVRGKVAFEGETPTRGLQSLRVTCPPADLDGAIPGGPAVQVAPDLSFELRGVFGSCMLNAHLADWTVKEIRHGGRDITDQPLDLSAEGSGRSVEILLTNRSAVLTGSVTGEGPGPAPNDYTIVAFPRDKARWRVPSPRIRTGRPDQNGRFQIAGLPPGEYLVAALQDIDEGAAQDPETLELLRALATPATLTDGGGQALSLKLSTLTAGR